MAEMASSFPVLGMQWAGPGSAEAAVSLLAAAGVSIPPSPAMPPPPPPNESSDTKGKTPKVSTLQEFRMDDVARSEKCDPIFDVTGKSERQCSA